MILQQPTVKTCTKCHIEKSIDQFNKQADKKSRNYPIGTKSHCKACISVYRKAFYGTPEGKKKGIEKSWKTKGINLPGRVMATQLSGLAYSRFFFEFIKYLIKYFLGNFIHF